MDWTGGGCGWDGKIFDGTGKFWIGREADADGMGRYLMGRDADVDGMGKYWMGSDVDVDGMGWEEINQSKVRRDAFFTLHIIHVGIKGMS